MYFSNSEQSSSTHLIGPLQSGVSEVFISVAFSDCGLLQMKTNLLAS